MDEDKEHFYMSMKTTNYLNEAPAILDFSSVTDEDLPLLEHFFNKYPSRSCDFSIGGVLLWSNYYDYKYAIYRDSLILMGTWPDSDLRIFYAPSGLLEIDEYTEAITAYCRQNGLKGIILLPEETLPTADGDGRPVEQTLMPDWMEYVYDIDKFRGFPGKKMSKKRNHLNFFKAHYPDCRIEEITEYMADELIEFTSKFSSEHMDEKVAVYESNEVSEALRHYSRYPYYGIALRIDGRIAGYTFGEVIGDTMIIHAEKGDMSYGGIYQALASDFAEASAEKFPQLRYLNREDDMGSEDLRKSKLSYHPAFFITKRVIAI